MHQRAGLLRLDAAALPAPGALPELLLGLACVVLSNVICVRGKADCNGCMTTMYEDYVRCLSRMR